ncbi:RNA polymerase II transcription factor SIII subunit A-domain-containing protein [Zychaea mexicana]|uniref:RNA polymerase II transcription factor SIII subunit A-domain-containing protein n=1 Tax=Zychaea mexicana TaxID=64656 RepID=UPI0022FEDAAA|nr:RNA polymerase II transcription factor SIII subunit A-domain-containing protein [Zychaea mexicana]KAI9495699.1 RNA polymerase II transcription factor SIII subunit A-domain-containing protein [Zychaea mexicana]
MSKEIKSLVTISQETLSRHLDGLDDVGSTPYSLLYPALRKATPRQLLCIEKANPHLVSESNELWLDHCLSYMDIREAYQQGEHRDPTKWRKTYMQRFKENERKREMISAKVKKRYAKIQDEKAARSIKVLSGHVPTHGRGSATYDSARRSQTSRLFQETRKAADRTHAMYRQPQKHPMRTQSTTPASSSSSPTPSIVQVSTPSSSLSQAYHNLWQQHNRPPPRQASYPPLVPPPHRLQQQQQPLRPPEKKPLDPISKSVSSNIPKRRRRTMEEPTSSPRSTISTTPSSSTSPSPQRPSSTTSKKPAALVNYDIFKQLS